MSPIMNTKLDSLWNNYAVAAGKRELLNKGVAPLGIATAAGAAVFALQPHAEATIIYSGPQNITASIGPGYGNNSQLLNIDGAGAADFVIGVGRFASYGTVYGNARLRAASSSSG